MIAYAETSASAKAAAQSLVDKVNDAILFPLMTLMVAVALLVFLWGAFEFIRGAADENARATGRRHMIWGIVGLFVMLSAYSILKVAAGTFPGVPVP